jgi:hypothetical protein
MALFSYNANEISISCKRFGGYFATHEGYAFDDATETLYEAVELDYLPIHTNIGVKSFLATLANYMDYWRNFKSVSTHDELVMLINKTLFYYGENFSSFYEADDFDDYIILLLEAQELLESQRVSEKELSYFDVSD